MYVEVLDLDAHEDVVLQLDDLAVADLEVANEQLLLLQLVSVDLHEGKRERERGVAQGVAPGGAQHARSVPTLSL